METVLNQPLCQHVFDRVHPRIFWQGARGKELGAKCELTTWVTMPRSFGPVLALWGGVDLELGSYFGVDGIKEELL